MENYKEKHKSHMATCHSPFADVYKYQSVNGDDEKNNKAYTLHAILHLQKCRSSNLLMEIMKKKQ